MPARYERVIVTDHQANIESPIAVYDLLEKYNVEPAIPLAETARLYEEPAKAIVALAERHGIIIDSTTLPQRLLVLDGPSFTRVAANEAGVRSAFLPAVTLPNQVGVIDLQAAKDFATKTGTSVIDALEEMGTHELMHIISYRDTWEGDNILPEGIKDGEKSRRHGLSSERPFERRFANNDAYGQTGYEVGLNILDEGFAHYRTRQVRQLLGKRLNIDVYRQEEEVVNKLISRIGESVFYEGALTRIGYLHLARAIRTYYKGNLHLREIADSLNADVQRVQQTREYKHKYAFTNYLILCKETPAY